ncbi:MAG: XRE family transcriptional regulator [Candidatus Tectomicrobia bacterium]|uniref:XRE family transcriptional regulator n=1 Tax=Tectimicrobiota bacterium TaxID=2528274 RepID=A0A932GNZ4_UNCTE|nr:XRE family transcriptional regulator [Candidatus Tectomicrobia bacterium]
MGSRVEEFLAQEMTEPTFRVAFAQAGAKRIKRALAEAVRKTRESQGLSQAALSKRARTTQAVVSRIENPKTSYLPSIEVLARLATALGAHLEISFVLGTRTAV